MRKKSTSELTREIIRCKTMDTFEVVNEGQTIEKKTLNEFLREMLLAHRMTKKMVITNSNIDTVYGYQIFQGRRSPSREVLLQLAFGFPLTVEETKYLLYYGGVETLYPRIRRDAYLMFALNKKMTLIDVNRYLFEKKEPAIGG